ncbi:oxidoreductase [Varunaivibrio sulfuroxidans]|uniref:NAD(P)-dependent dehydrogenase (Short-subunit alcohol dehydrogenase family) n=1 Tax=Varunaivibrio sulfuroxidans TaxID=1773489 RepID=A0A4R3J6I1_9PROT|nr:oxidoreductase [Varunaivibrio sulfuroxidans]TCS60945.1 NAD(P)-dependent dehydrogenase (short-subunit alcohol dehydrogenase family) [Varunaivibrio sulfuroxidans]WES31647.1 oxidoreductase [Varunaivibrio sulfuroxidans]
MNIDLSDRVIIITGSSGGIGWAIAREVHASGARVVLHGTREEALREKVRELDADETSKRADWVSADLADPEAPARIIAKAVDTFGRLDGLVNNAGIFPRNNLTSITVDDFEHIFAVNARAPLFLCQGAAARFRAQKSPGSIVNIGSINAHCGQSDILAYSMSKGALQTMTRNLGDALGAEGIRVNQLNVGWTYTDTEHKVQLAEGRPENWLEQVPKVFAPSGSILRPEQIAPHAVFWLSDASWPINGQVYEVEQYPVIGRNKINEG